MQTASGALEGGTGTVSYTHLDVYKRQVADPEKLENDPFIQRVMSDAEQIAAAETEQTSEVSISDEEYDAVRRPTPQRDVYKRQGLQTTQQKSHTWKGD